MFRRHLTHTAGVFLATLLFAGIAAAQSISGVIYDPEGAVIPNATIVLVDPASATPAEAKSGAAGEFSFTGLAPAAYRLEVRNPGFATYQQRIPVGAGETARVYPILQLGRVMETIEVTGSARASTAVSPARVRAGGRVDPPRILKAPQPAYPASAQSRGAQGPVLVQAVILQDGTLGSMHVLSAPDSDLRSAALEALNAWRYTPALLNGRPVEVATTVVVTFRLPQ
jgi:TonB family protein